MIQKRSLKINGHPTSISLEEPFWSMLKDIAAAQNKPFNQLASEIDEKRGSANLSSALRVYVLEYLKSQTGQ